MADLRNALLQAGQVSEQRFLEAEEDSRRKEKERSQQQLDMLEREHVKKLLVQLRRLTSVRKFRGCARQLLLLQPDCVDAVAKLVQNLPRQEGLAELLEQVARLEWLPSLSDEEQEALVRQTL